MLNGFGTIMDDLKGKAQALVGQMLMARNTLNQLVKSSDPNIASQANQLLLQQTDLEAELAIVNKDINSGESLGIARYAEIGLFFVKVKTHVDSVESLGKSMGGEITWANETNISIAIGIFAALSLGTYLLTKRR